MTDASERWLERMAHRDHLVVCRALREVADSNPPSSEVMERVLALVASPVAAVETRALRTLARFGARAERVQGGAVEAVRPPPPGWWWLRL